jgi:hypothetical protein
MGRAAKQRLCRLFGTPPNPDQSSGILRSGLIKACVSACGSKRSGRCQRISA